VIRLISARAATSKERKPYEEAHKRSEAPSRRHRRQNRRRHLIRQTLGKWWTGAARKSENSTGLRKSR
jgi:hypothetical protein